MPSCFPLQVLDHDAGEYDHLCINVVENLPVREIEPVGYVGRDPGLERNDD